MGLPSLCSPLRRSAPTPGQDDLLASFIVSALTRGLCPPLPSIPYSDAEPPIRKMLSCVDLWSGGPQVVPPYSGLFRGWTCLSQAAEGCQPASHL